jgi:hypothetical protein
MKDREEESAPSIVLQFWWRLYDYLVNKSQGDTTVLDAVRLESIIG